MYTIYIYHFYVYNNISSRYTYTIYIYKHVNIVYWTAGALFFFMKKLILIIFCRYAVELMAGANNRFTDRRYSNTVLIGFCVPSALKVLRNIYRDKILN